jgi:hypothetical protein
MHRKLSNRETAVLNALGAKPTINSGATFGDNDGVLKNTKARIAYGIEVKATDAKSFSIKLDTWKKAQHEANRIGLEPLLAVDIQKTTLIVLSIDEFLTLLDRIE